MCGVLRALSESLQRTNTNSASSPAKPAKPAKKLQKKQRAKSATWAWKQHLNPPPRHSHPPTPPKSTLKKESPEETRNKRYIQPPSQQLPITKTPLTTRSTLQNQQTSLLLRLAPELRNTIYAHVLRGQTFAFPRRELKSPRYITCPCIYYRFTPPQSCISCYAFLGPLFGGPRAQTPPHRPICITSGGQILVQKMERHPSLRRVCRQIYGETEGLVFAMNSFVDYAVTQGLRTEGMFRHWRVYLKREELAAIRTVGLAYSAVYWFFRNHVVDLEVNGLRGLSGVREVRLLMGRWDLFDEVEAEGTVRVFRDCFGRENFEVVWVQHAVVVKRLRASVG